MIFLRHDLACKDESGRKIEILSRVVPFVADS